MNHSMVKILTEKIKVFDLQQSKVTIIVKYIKLLEESLKCYQLNTVLLGTIEK